MFAVLQDVVDGYNYVFYELACADLLIDKTWRKLKDCYSRVSWAKSESVKSGKKKRKYIFFDQLSFLIPITTPRDTSGDIKSIKECVHSETPSDDNNRQQKKDSRKALSRRKTGAQGRKESNDEDELLNILPPTSRDWFLVGKPFYLICIMIFYLYFCTRLGPRLMKHKDPFDVTKPMIVYNVFQIFLSIYLFQEALHYILFYNFDFKCQGVSTDPAIRTWIARGVWIFYMAKISELLDTVFFVLRKSNRQISSLHLHHHTLMPIAAWFGTTYFPGGQGILVGFFNAIVHTVMYTYYLISGFGDKYKNHLWWKKYVTLLQIIQFLILWIHSVNSLFYSCEYFLSFKILTIFYCSYFTYSFGKFYYQNYIKKAKTVNGVKSSSKKENKLLSDSQSSKKSK